MEFRENKLANKASNTMSYIFVMLIFGILNVINGIMFVLDGTSPASKIAFGVLLLACAIVFFTVLIPYKITLYIRLMGQAVREDNELGLEKPMMTRAEAGRAVTGMNN